MGQRRKRKERQRAGRLAIAICAEWTREEYRDREERITGGTGRRGATGGARSGGQVWEEGKDGGGGEEGEGSGGGKAEAECNEFEKSGALRLHT